MEKCHNQDNSNSESSSDSDDSNNDSDSSSIDSDAEKNEKENGNERVVKPFRINLTKVSMDVINIWSIILHKTNYNLNVFFRIMRTRGKSHHSQRNKQ